MKQLIERFPLQMKEAIQIGKQVKLSKKQNIQQVLVSGLGGSGIGASIVQEYVFDKLSIPFAVNKDYFIPKWVNGQTLFVACSYSGNTEETLLAVSLAKKAKANIVCITSGGALAYFAEKNNYPCIRIPEGMPPRSCLGYSFVQLLFILKNAGLLKNNIEKELMDGIQFIGANKSSIQKKAKSLASKLVNKQIAIYMTGGRDGLGIRFRQQLNENAKVVSWSNVIPEMTHNEIVGWRNKNESVAVVCCYHKNDFGKNLRRLRVLKNVVRKYSKQVYDIELLGKHYWEQALYFIHLTDWVSVYLSDLNGHDPVEVKVIDYLKSEMAKEG